MSRSESPVADSTLHVVATPIGNLGDLSPRAIEVLRSCSLIFAEDTRHTVRLLNYFEIRSQLIACHEHNEFTLKERLERLARDHSAMAYVSDAGTPGISDPGRHLVAQARQLGIRVVPVPGVSAVAAALSVAGFDVVPFTFWGFVPAKEKERRALLARIETESGAAVIFVPPRLIATTLTELAATFPGREVLVAREITKLHEEYLHAVLPDLPVVEDRGECTMVLGPAPRHRREGDDEDRFLCHLSTKDHLLVLMMERGWSKRDAVQRVATVRGLPKREVYEVALTLDGE